MGNLWQRIRIMAKGRRYARDNRGRFASTGATARGGRLKTAGGNKRATVTVNAKGGSKGTIGKPRGLKPGTLKPKTQSMPQPVRRKVQGPKVNQRESAARAKELRQKADKLDQRGNSLMGGGSSRDTAIVNVPLSSRARSGSINSGLRGLDMSRQAQQLRSKAGSVEIKALESRAKVLRSVHEKAIVDQFSKKMGKPAAEVRSAIRGMPAAKQVKLLKQWVKENRATARRR